ncbi:MAG: enoyl-CoA hydratase/isomerase family protein [Gammaproteobacteria bacterium]|nr:enoyl-CoA hydratase/isomerase family protein [Gammaproteobacteria bacterium]
MDKPILLSSLMSRLYSASAGEELSVFAGVPYLIVEVDDDSSSFGYAPSCPVIAISDRAAPAIADVVVSNETDAVAVAEAVSRNPIAAMVLVRLLRHNENVDAYDGLFAESLAYSTLQHGAEFESWLNERKPREPVPEPDEPPVLLAREGNVLRVTLNRPTKRNAFSGAMRDALCEALQLLADDRGIVRAILDGAGVCFSAVGDLDEFGEARDAGRAHASRVTRSAGALVHKLRERIVVHLHGACIGAGIELPAFAGHVTARPDAFFQLPEVSFGLVPGAGGTVSILPRIGRHRLAYMALTASRIDAVTALEWGLVDEIEDG